MRNPVRFSELDVRSQASVVEAVLRRCSDRYGVTVHSMLSPYRGTKAEQRGRAAAIYVLVEMGMDRNELARLLGRSYETIGTNLLRSRTKMVSDGSIRVAYKELREVTLEVGRSQVRQEV